jgi:hypothetical protein
MTNRERDLLGIRFLEIEAELQAFRLGEDDFERRGL